MSTILAERLLPRGQTIQLVHGDITAETTDAIVNAANKYLQHGAGVAGAIARRGGRAIQQESEEWVRDHGTVSHSHPARTSGGLLAAKHVIHAVGPVWGDGDEDAKLAAAIQGSFRFADELELSSIALPAISTGIFGFPQERAASVMFAAIEEYFSQHDSGINLVRVVLLGESTIGAFMSKWSDAFRRTGSDEPAG